MRSGAQPRCALVVEGLSKTFAGPPALDRFDLEVAPGEIHALVGENGSGKSTFIKILSGYHTPDPGGRVVVDGEPLDFGSNESSWHLGCRFVHQDLGLVANLSVLDNLSLHGGFPTRFGTIRGRTAVAEARRDLQRVALEIDPLTLVEELPPALKTGVAVARALRLQDARPVKLLVLDEPTATLPENQVEQLLATVRTVAANGIAVLYVTHRLDEVFELASNVTVLRDGRKVATRTTASLDRRQLVSLLVGTELDEVKAASQDIHTRADEPILRVADLTAGPIRGLSFEAGAGEIVGVAGITGSGRDYLLGALFGANPRDGGVVAVSGDPLAPFSPRRAMESGMGYLPGERTSLAAIMSYSARENLTLADLQPFWSRLHLHTKSETAETRTWFERLRVRPGGAFEAQMSTFSGGNQQKLIFAKWLRRRPKVLLLDEPTQGVDIGAKAELHRQVLAAAEGGAAVVVSSSDVDELVALCHRVIVLRNGRLVALLRGEDITVAAVSKESLGAGEEVYQ